MTRGIFSKIFFDQMSMLWTMYVYLWARTNIGRICLKFFWLILLSLPHVWAKALCSITYRYWLNYHLKSGDPGFLVVLAVFVADFEALIVIVETRSKQHQIRREKLVWNSGDRLELANWNLRKKREKLWCRVNLLDRPGRS